MDTTGQLSVLVVASDEGPVDSGAAVILLWTKGVPSISKLLYSYRSLE